MHSIVSLFHNCVPRSITVLAANKYKKPRNIWKKLYSSFRENKLTLVTFLPYHFCHISVLKQWQFFKRKMFTYGAHSNHDDKY